MSRSILFTIVLLTTQLVVSAAEPNPILPGDPRIKGTKLKPFLAQYRMDTEVDGKPELGGYRTHHLQEARYPGGRGFRFHIAMFGQDTVYDETRFLADGFAPVARMVSCRSLVHKFEIFQGFQLQSVQTDKDGGNSEQLDLVMDGERFQSGTAPFILAGMELKIGFQAVFPIFSSDMGAKFANGYESIEVIGRERLKTESGQSYYTWVLERRFLDRARQPLKLGGREFPVFKTWLAKEPPYMIQAERGNTRQVLINCQSIPIFKVPE